MSDLTLVRYVRNFDSKTATAAITFSDDRDALQIGQLGYMTVDEIRRAESYGVELQVVEDESDIPAGVVVPDAPGEDPDAITADLGEKRLEEIAEEEGVDLTGKRSNRAKAEAIIEARSAQPEGAESLPATAVVDPSPTA